MIDYNAALLERARERLASIPIVRVLANTEEQGLSGARNTGVGAAHGDVVAFIDDDAAAEPDWLERLCRHYANPSVVGVGGAIEPLWLAGRPKSFPPEFDWVVGCTYRGHRETAGPVRNVIGANMSFRRSIFRDVGGFRSDIGRSGARPSGCEETEFCQRAASGRPNVLIVYEPRARVLHTVPGARGSWSYFLRRCYAEGLSKAVVSRLAGSADGLTSERSYVRSTLSRGVLANVAQAVTGRDASAFVRALRMVVGLGATTAGYTLAAARLALRARAPKPSIDEAA